MLNDAQRFWDAIVGKVRRTAQDESKNALRLERYEVTTAANGTKMGVTLPMGTKEIFLPYSNEVASAGVGTPVLVGWWGSMSNAKVYYFADGYKGGLAARPIGSFYISEDSTSPAEIFGGMWQRITGQFLFGTDTTETDPGIYPAGSTGGEAEHYHSTQGHTLTVDEIPSHNHEPLDSRAFVTTDRSHTPNRTTVASGSGATGILHSDIGLVRQNNTAARGGGGSHSHGNTGSASNMPPYLAVYIWKRVA